MSRTSVVFKPGQPPAKVRRGIEGVLEAWDAEHFDGLAKRSSLPSYLATIASSAVSSACQCLSLSTPVATVKSTKTATSTTSVPYPVKTTTIYRKFHQLSSNPYSLQISKTFPSSGPCHSRTLLVSSPETQSILQTNFHPHSQLVQLLYLL